MDKVEMGRVVKLVGKSFKVIRGVPVLGHRDKAVVLTHAFNEIYDEKEKDFSRLDWSL